MHPKFSFQQTLLFILPLCWIACNTLPKSGFTEIRIPPKPNYAQLDCWAAHPSKNDLADRTPNGLQNKQDQSNIDVFFLHPTSYTGSKKYDREWNADVNNSQVNQRTDEASILFQGSLFNSTGRIYAPRYRQAHLQAFYEKKDTLSAKKALDIAYQDVKSAFLYYLEHENKGRPFILAAHSQGARHLKYLLRELIENKPLAQQMVVAYIVGFKVEKNFFPSLQPCKSADDTNCFCTWRTFERKYGLNNGFESDIWCTNPILWSTEEGKYAAKDQNKGAVIRPFEKVLPQVADAEVYKGILLCSKPKFPGSILFVTKNYHPGDFNLYYMNVRENAENRVISYYNKK